MTGNSTTGTSSGQVQAAQQINKANIAQSGQALAIQNYCNSVDEQPNVDFSGLPELAKYQTEINSGLATAQGHANTYLNVIQPNIIQNIANIANFYAMELAVIQTLSSKSTTEELMEDLKLLRSQSQQYEKFAITVVASLQTLHDNLSHDSTKFKGMVNDLNTAVGGDDGVLKTLNSELNSIQSQIDGAIAGTVLSGLAVVGGAFITAVGAVADFVTAGTSTGAVAGGVAIVAVGIGGETASAITLKNLNDEKANLLRQEVTLTAEVQLAALISSGYQSLTNKVKLAINAASEMADAWTFLKSDLNTLIDDVNTGIKNPAAAYIELTTVGIFINNTLTPAINNINAQMAGVTNIVASPGQTVGEAIVAAVQS